MTFGTYAEGWRAVQVHRPSTAAQVQSHLSNHLLPALSRRPIASIRPSEVQGLVKTWSTTLAPATVEVVFRCLASIMKAAVRDRLIGSSPCDGVKLPKVPHPQVDPWPVERVEVLTEAMPDRYQALIVLAATTGLRQDEVFGLTLDNLDMLRRTVRVSSSWCCSPEESPTWPGPRPPRAIGRCPCPR